MLSLCLSVPVLLPPPTPLCRQAAENICFWAWSKSHTVHGVPFFRVKFILRITIFRYLSVMRVRQN